jgi:hypothetical protein
MATGCAGQQPVRCHPPGKPMAYASRVERQGGSLNAAELLTLDGFCDVLHTLKPTTVIVSPTSHNRRAQMQYLHERSGTDREIRCEHASILAFEKRPISSQPMTSVDVIGRLLELNPDIAYMRFVTYQQKATPAVAKRLDAIKGAFLQHNDNQNFPIARSQLRKEEILRMCSVLPQRACLAVDSRVQTLSNERQFIPMLDFVCEKSEDNKRFLVELLSDLNRRVDIDIAGGFLLESYNSYHYYGGSPLSLDKWTRFIGFSLLMHPPLHYMSLAKRVHAASVIDVRHLGHSLIRGGSALRISANPDGQLPSVVAVISA